MKLGSAIWCDWKYCIRFRRYASGKGCKVFYLLSLKSKLSRYQMQLGFFHTFPEVLKFNHSGFQEQISTSVVLKNYISYRFPLKKFKKIRNSKGKSRKMIWNIVVFSPTLLHARTEDIQKWAVVSDTGTVPFYPKLIVLVSQSSLNISRHPITQSQSGNTEKLQD